jgi:carbamoyltransferase
MQKQMNLKIKFRESFRPFAPAILEEYANDYVDLLEESPYMLLVGPVQEKHRSDIPAVTHVDYSARVQTLSEERNGMFYRVVKAFHKTSGCPVVINTSFNIRGEPIVNTPEEAYRCFMYTDMDALVLENCVLLKENQPPLAGADEYKMKFRKQD